jgi:hypothetical protein
VGIHHNLHDKFISSHDGKRPRSTKAFVHPVCKIEYHDIVSSGMFVDEFREKCPQEWTIQAVIFLKAATEAYIVEVIAESHY